MKKVVIALLLVLVLPLICSVEVEMKDSFKQSETLIAKVSGNFIEQIQEGNVFFYKGQVIDLNFMISVEHEVFKVGDDFYIYGLLGDKTAGDYSLVIRDVEYMKGAERVTDEIIAYFSITDEVVDFTVQPGFVLADGDFSLTIQNLNDNKLEINVTTEKNFTKEREIFVLNEESLSKETSILFKTGEKKKIDFSLGVGESAIREIELSAGHTIYEIPVYIPEGEGERAKKFKIEPSEFELVFLMNQDFNRTVTIYNLGETELTNISLKFSDEISPYISSEVVEIENLSGNSQISVSLDFFSEVEVEEIDGVLEIMSSEGEEDSIDISVKFLESYNESEVPVEEEIQSCAELNGTICKTKTQECSDGDFVEASDGWCCPNAVCVDIETSNTTGRVIAIILIVLVVGGIILFYLFKYKKIKKPINFFKIAKGKKKFPVDKTKTEIDLKSSRERQKGFDKFKDRLNKNI